MNRIRCLRLIVIWTLECWSCGRWLLLRLLLVGGNAIFGFLPFLPILVGRFAQEAVQVAVLVQFVVAVCEGLLDLLEDALVVHRVGGVAQSEWLLNANAVPLGECVEGRLKSGWLFCWTHPLDKPDFVQPARASASSLRECWLRPCRNCNAMFVIVPNHHFHSTYLNSNA